MTIEVVVGGPSIVELDIVEPPAIELEVSIPSQPGEQGPPGPPGPSGPPGDANHLGVPFSFPSPAGSWPIHHGMNTYPEVLLFVDPDRTERVITDVIYTDLDNILVEWPSPESGMAYLR